MQHDSVARLVLTMADNDEITQFSRCIKGIQFNREDIWAEESCSCKLQIGSSEIADKKI